MLFLKITDRRNLENYHYLAPNHNQFNSMKKLLFLPLISFMLLSGCKDKIVVETAWDYPNLEIIIDLRDSKGQSWFDASRQDDDDMRDNKVKITYNGATYNMVFLDPNTRAEEPDLPDWDEDGRNPFRLQGYHDTGGDSPVQLLFGEFSADTKNYRGESFTIDWGDGTESVVKFDLYATPNADKEIQPTVTSAIWVESGLGTGTRNNNALVLRIVK